MRDQPTSSTHPLLPPTTEEDRVAWLRLLRSRRVGIATFYRLMAEHGSAAAALDALPDIARAAGVNGYQAARHEDVMREIDAGRRIGARPIFVGSAEYPDLLAQIPDAPPILWLRGTAKALGRPSVSVVGARNASSLGTRMTRALAGELGEAGFTVISGLARGIDTCAHLATLEHGTIAVLAGGVDILYPAENTRLAEDMLTHGALISEQPMGMAPIARHFPVRNRIISGLSHATIVVEAAAKSGSLITARGALDQGRDVLAVPGHPFDARAAGCNMLIRDGAILVRSAQDVIEHIGPIAEAQPDLPLPDTAAPYAPPQVSTPDAQVQMPPIDANTLKTPMPHDKATQSGAAVIPLSAARKPMRSLADVASLHQRILDRLGPSPVSEDQVLRDAGLKAETGLPILTDLELKGRINRAPGGLISRS